MTDRLREIRAAAAVGGTEGSGEDDVRTLAVRFEPRRERHRPYPGAVSQVYETEFADFPLPGPRTALWLL